jgi:Holliday junction DNA helicase RuvA
MIEHLRGQVLSVEGDHVVVDVGGVGYGLDVPASTAERLPAAGGETALHVTMVVKEDAFELYGFASVAEKRVFEILFSVSGIGPRTALDILSQVTVRELVNAIQTGHVEALTHVSGIGPKKAERLILELKGRLKRLLPYVESRTAPAAGPGGPGSEGAQADRGNEFPAGAEGSLFADAVAALEALGFKPPVASRCVATALRAAGDRALTVQELVKAALQNKG